MKIPSSYKSGDRIFKDYVCKGYLGEGGFGKVYLTENSIGLPYALKVLHKDVELEKRGVESVMHIQSNRLVSIHEYGVTVEGEACILMEYVKENLAREIDKQGSVDEEKAVHYFKEILKGLKTLEENGVLHRDIKPANLFILEDIVKIGDFGLSRYTSGESSIVTSGLGTLEYSAPESFGEQYGFSADRWSAAVVLFQLLTGRTVFQGKSNKEIFSKILTAVPDLSIVPEKYQSFFDRCFRKEPKARYDDSESMLRDLELGSVSAESEKGKKEHIINVDDGPVCGNGAGDSGFESDGNRTFTNSLEMKFVYIKPGSFLMGSPNSEKGRYIDEKQHEVVIAEGFFLQDSAVTIGQWTKIMADAPLSFHFERNDEWPVILISWFEVQEFITKLNENLKDNSYRLPTEAEWEYACRAGSLGAFSFGNNTSKLSNYAWYMDNSNERPHPVKMKKPNAWGINDMHGNIWEWCQDWYGEYHVGISDNPKGAMKGDSRVLRGGAWNYRAEACRSSSRIRHAPEFSANHIGFRLVKA